MQFDKLQVTRYLKVNFISQLNAIEKLWKWREEIARKEDANTK
jgi:ribonuclease D